ncbi:MAG: kelch repeat-containing protein [Candidatus Binataceae bacterium]
MKSRVLCVVAFAFVCASCGGSSGGSGGGPKPQPINQTVQVPGLMTTGRFTSAVTLASGNVLEVAGFGSLQAVVLTSGEVYHPATNSFTKVANQLPIPANHVCLAALQDGTALEVGGQDNLGNNLLQAEIYNPTTNSFAPTTGAMNDPRYGCTATTLADGTVLIAGGDDNTGGPEHTTDTAEIYDPTSGTFTFTKGTMIGPRGFHTAVLLTSGKVLLAGGLNASTPLSSAELYDPTTGTFSATAGPLNTARFEIAGILLADGRALLAGGVGASGVLDTAELYDPNASTFSLTANDMSIGRRLASAAPLSNGNAIVGAGSSQAPNQLPDATCDSFDAATNSFAPTAPLHIARMDAATVVLPDGSPLILGGIDNQGTSGGNYEPSGEIYDPTAASFTVTGGLNSLRIAYASARLDNGEVLIAGGATQSGLLATAEVFDPSTGYFTPTANNLDVARVSLNAVTLPSGKVLIDGGSTGTTAELFDPATMSFALTGSMTAARSVATATLLNDGTVLIAGGLDPGGDSLDTAEIYNPKTATFTATSGVMTTPRALHTATLLKNGEVLLAGGSTSSFFSDVLDTAEIYNPKTQTFTATAGTMTSLRASATANLLKNGQVLIAGGAIANGSSLASAELFDPATGQFTATSGSMSNSRVFQSSVSLPNGEVMIAGGSIGTFSGVTSYTSVATVDFYDPSSEQFVPAVPMISPRDFFVATLLTSGKVLLPAGRVISSAGIGIAALETAEIYTP